MGRELKPLVNFVKTAPCAGKFGRVAEVMAMGICTAQNAPLGLYCPSSLSFVAVSLPGSCSGVAGTRLPWVRAETVPRLMWCKTKDWSQCYCERSCLLHSSTTIAKLHTSIWEEGNGKNGNKGNVSGLILLLWNRCIQHNVYHTRGDLIIISVIVSSGSWNCSMI